jgi:hypothetical protein
LLGAIVLVKVVAVIRLIRIPVLIVLLFWTSSSTGRAEAKVATKCGANQYLVRAHFRRAYQRADGTFVSAATVESHCRDRSRIFEVWISKFTSDLPAGWPSKERAVSWTEEEKLRIIDALETLPDLLTSQSVRAVVRVRRSVEPHNPASISDGGNLAIYDTAFAKDLRLARVLAHELSHRLFQSSEDTLQYSYRKATGWRLQEENRVLYRTRRKSGFVESDGANSPEEDFANNVEYFLFDQEKLKAVLPAAEVWLQSTFGDKLKLKGSGK